MGNVILCVGSYAETPYYLERSGVRIFCIEELCFFLRENSLLLDPEIMKPELAEWVKLECALPELAKEMKRYLKEKRTINEYVNLIMKGAHYCTESEWKEIDRLITESKNWNSNERMKGRTDYHFQNGKYLYALRAYEALYHDLKQEDPLLAAKVLHNLGTVYAKLFLFEIAASYYKQAYDLGGEKESRQAFLAANRMYRTEQDYVDFIAEQKDHFEDTMELEKKMELLQSEYELSNTKKQLDQILQWKNSQKMTEYYEKLEEMVRIGKEAYRANALDLL